MELKRSYLKEEAKEALRGNWGTAIGTMFLIALISLLAMIPFIGWIVSIFILPAFSLGMAYIYLGLARREQVGMGTLFEGFSFLLKAVGLTLMTGLLIILWSLLLIVPGIIATYKYSMAIFILADNPEKGVMECIRESANLTDGYKLDLFVLDLSFIGWSFLAGLTFGILALWVVPYVGMTSVQYYLVLSGQKIDNVN